MLKPRLAKQQMNVLRHDHIPQSAKPETAPDPLQAQLKDSSVFVRGKQNSLVITTEGNEMALPAMLKPRQSPRLPDVASASRSLLCRISFLLVFDFDQMQREIGCRLSPKIRAAEENNET
jgi:hypothetical protein